MLAAACQNHSLCVEDFKCHNKTSAFCQYENMREMIGFHQTDACGLSYFENEVKLILRHYVRCMCLTAESEAASMPLRRHLKRAKSNKNLSCEDSYLSEVEYFITTGCFICPRHHSYACEPNLPERAHDHEMEINAEREQEGKPFIGTSSGFFGKDLFKDI